MSALRSLLLLGIILTASGVFSEQLGPIVGPVEYNGYLVFDYPEGDNPIVNIVFNVDPWVGECLLILNVPAPWTYTYSDPILTLSGGSLNPGGSVSITVSLDDYFEEGEYQVTSIGTTSAGEVSNAVGPLLVGDMYLMQVISLVNSFQTPLLASVLGLATLELIFWWRNRPFRSIIPPVKEVNNFVRDSEKILNKEGAPKIKVTENKPDPDLEHKSVIPELAPYDGSVPIDHSKKDSSELPRDLKDSNKNDSDKSIPWNIAKTTEVVIKMVEDSLDPKTKYSGVDPPDSIKPDLLDDENSVAPDLAKYDLYKPPSDRAKELSLEELDGGSTDSVEYDDSDLPGLDEMQETDPFPSELDDSDLPGLDDTPETTDNGDDEFIEGRKVKKPLLKPDEVIEG